MTVGRTVALIGMALRPGASLAHNPNRLTASDALAAMGHLKEPAGAAVLHSRIGGEDAAAVKLVLLEWCVSEFERQGWQVSTRKHTVAYTMRRFVDQVWREFFGKACRRCEGRGFAGRKFDAVRHGLVKCRGCKGHGFVESKGSRAGKRSNALSRSVAVHRTCSECDGRRYVDVKALERGQKLKACSQCDGTGKVRPSLRARGRALDLSAPIIQKVWRERFQVVLQELRRIERASLLDCDNYLFPD